MFPTMWGPPVISWFRSAPVTIVISAINHSYGTYFHQLSYRTGASHCTFQAIPQENSAASPVGAVGATYWFGTHCLCASASRDESTSMIRGNVTSKAIGSTVTHFTMFMGNINYKNIWVVDDIGFTNIKLKVAANSRCVLTSICVGFALTSNVKGSNIYRTTPYFDGKIYGFRLRFSRRNQSIENDPTGSQK